MTTKNYGELTISQIDKELGKIYRTFKAENGGKKTSTKGKYGFKTIQFVLRNSENKETGPFFGRGSLLSEFRKTYKKGTGTGTAFVIQEIFKPKAKGKVPTIDSEHVLILGGKKIKA